MSPELSGLQILFIWRLLSLGGGGYWGERQPKVTTRDRKLLEAASLIQTETRMRHVEGRRSSRSYYVSLTDRGWHWAAENLDAPIPTLSRAAVPILRDLLVLLKSDLQRTDRTLADFLSNEPLSLAEAVTPIDEGCPKDHGRLEDVVRSAYRELSSGRSVERVRLAQLRKRLHHVPRLSLDQALLEMERQDQLVFYPLDNQRELTSDDEAAALLNSAGQQRHVVYMGT